MIFPYDLAIYLWFPNDFPMIYQILTNLPGFLPHEKWHRLVRGAAVDLRPLPGPLPVPRRGPEWVITPVIDMG